MAGPWEKYATPPQAQGPWNKYAPSRGMQGMLSGAPLMSNGMKDIRDQAAVGLVEGVASGPGMLGDLGRMYDPEKEAAVAKQSPFGETAYNVLNAPQRAMAWGMSKLPSTDDIMGGIAKLGGEPIPEAETPAGGWARLGGNFLPLGAASLPRNAAKQAIKQAPSNARNMSEARRNYDKAEASGHVFDAQSYDNLVADIGQAVVNEGAHPTLHPRTVATVKEMAGYVGGPMTVKDMQTMRRLAQAAAKSADADERRLGKIIKDKIDDFMAPVPEMAEGNKLYARAKKGEDIDRLIRVGESKGKSWQVGGGPENAIRRGFSNFAAANNGKNMRRFSKSEQAAIEHVAEGTRPQRVVRAIGSIAPTSAIPILGGLGGMYAGYNEAGMKGMLSGAALGALTGAARLKARSATRKNARMASALVRSGGQLPKYRSGRPTREQLLAAILGSSAAVNSQ